MFTSENDIAILPRVREHAACLTSELTKSFVKGTLKILMKRLEVDSGALFLFDPAQGTLVLDSVQGFVQSGRMVQRWPVTKSSLSIPLFVEGELFGLLKIGTKDSGKNFSQKDLRFANALCKNTCRIVEDQVRFTKIRRVLDRIAKEKTALEKYCSVGNLAAGIVGEINSPLDGALRYIGLTLSQPEVGLPRQREYLAEMKKGLERIAEITANLSRLSNPVPVQSIDQPTVDIQQLLNESIDLFSASFKDSIRVTIHNTQPLRVRIDKVVRHVFTNVIKNALDAMPSGGELEISSEIKQAGLQICFRDTGSGILPEHQDLIFDPFFTTKPKGVGTGLGLSLCRDIVTKYGGRIGLKSAPGKGTTFTILFPKEVLVK
jgi:two-component system, NtrC family, sensor kinase